MTESSARRPQPGPEIGAPPPFVERRVNARRVDDQLNRRETTLLARSLDILVDDRPAEGRLAALLGLLAHTVGAGRAAVLSVAPERRIAVAAGEDEDPAAALALAAWLDARGPGSRAERAAAAPATITIVRAGSTDRQPQRSAPDADRHYAWVEIPSSGRVVLGFELASAAAVETVGDRLPSQMARHAAVALALVTDQMAGERTAGDLEARDRERERYVSTVAHDLRTPLTGLAGYLELIADGRVEDPAIRSDFLERSREIVETMADLVADLLEMSKIEAGNLALDLAPFSIADVSRRVLGTLKPIGLKRSVDLRSDLPPRIRAAVGDRRRVEQILTNLTGNALKFTPEGGTVEIAAWFDGRVALLAVRDDGAGIDAEDRPRIFERFYRLPGHARITGTGLGLPIARELARAMGGDLDVASVLESGSSFVLALPGPAAVELDVLRASLDAALSDEENHLEEAAVIRAMRAAQRAQEPSGERAEPSGETPQAD
ncbi:MAG TPA: HAMP domain-containing sensor histidine kinase [Candidatus Limnocylindrales bacterium]|nr:HAMP domain-containing sensor histidine kinase [Candidatus Limnocylindrales bacterium]